MTEDFIIDMLTLNLFNYHNFKEEQFKQEFTNWMYKLKHLKNFRTIDEACNYFIAKGEKDEKLPA